MKKFFKIAITLLLVCFATKITAYPNVVAKYNLLSTALKTTFEADFGTANAASLAKLNEDSGELVEVWKKWNDKGIKSIEDLTAFKKVWKQSIRNVSFDDFHTKTGYQIGKVADKKFAPELYEVWTKGKGNEKGLQAVYTKYGLDPSKEYPPCEGVWGVDIRVPTTNENFDRFQTREGLGGGYAGVVSTTSSYTISSRALMENYSELVDQGKDYFYYKFKLKTIPSDLKFEYGEAIPWFGEQGEAIQVKKSNSFQNLSSEIEMLETCKMTGGVWNKMIDFSTLNIPATMQHVKFRDFSTLRKNGIGGCHDAIEFAKIRQVSESGFTMPIGKTLDEVPEIIISSIKDHPTVPGVKIVEYKIPILDSQLKTTGELKSVDPKTIYEPVIWTDSKLDKALKEALQNSSNTNSNILKSIWDGLTIEGYPIRGYFRDNKISTFYFK
jgi:Bacterial EndoU nuclease